MYNKSIRINTLNAYMRTILDVILLFVWYELNVILVFLFLGLTVNFGWCAASDCPLYVLIIPFLPLFILISLHIIIRRFFKKEYKPETKKIAITLTVLIFLFIFFALYMKESSTWQKQQIETEKKILEIRNERKEREHFLEKCLADAEANYGEKWDKDAEAISKGICDSKFFK